VHLAPTLRHAPAIGDPRLLERLVDNLVDNALRYNLASGRLEVSTGTRAGDAVLSVTNTGPVVPADQVDRLFQPFQRLSEDRTRHDGGLGLGLSIVHAIATAHGATVRACPRPAGGMVFTVSFPGGGTDPHPARHSRPADRCHRQPVQAAAGDPSVATAPEGRRERWRRSG
jgi:signal transduction histidine kinase